jgi:hypothetical protein
MMVTALLLLALAPAAIDVAVVDRGGGPDRVAAVVAAVPQAFAGGVAVAATDVADLDRQYIVPCAADDACLVRTMASIAVGAIVFVEADAIVAIERVRLRSRRQPAPTTASLRGALDDAIHPERFGTLVIEGAPTAARILVDGAPWTGGEVAAGSRTIVVDADGFVPHTVVVAVPPAGIASVVVPPPVPSTTAVAPTPPPTVSPTGPPAGVALAGVGVGVAVLGVATGLLGEVQAAAVVAALRRGEARDDLLTWEVVELGGFAVGIVGAILGVVGVVMATSAVDGAPPSAAGEG